MSNNVSGTSGTSRTCSTQDDDDDGVHNEEMATRQAQRLLNDLNPGRLKESGKLDEGTVLALKAFQRDNHLEVTGKADGPTIAKLEDAIRAKDQPAKEEAELQREARAHAEAKQAPTMLSMAQALVGPALAQPLGSLVSMGSALDLETKTAQLTPGGSYEIKARAAGRVEIGMAESASAKMTCNKDGTYTLEVSADVAAIAGISAGVGIEASVAAGGKLTFTAKNKEEAVRMANIASRACIEGATLSASRHVGHAVRRDEATFMADHCSAVTVRSTAGVKVAAEAGVSGAGALNGTGVEASATGEAIGSFTIKLDHGKVTDIVAEGEVRTVVDARAAVGPKDAPGAGFKVSGAALSIGVGANGEGRMKITQHFEVPPGATLRSLVTGSKGSLLASENLAAVANLKKTTVDAELYVEGRVDANAVGVGAGVGSRAKITLKNIGNPTTVAVKLRFLDVEGAAKALPTGSTMQVHVATTQVGKALDVGGTVEGAGIKFSAKLSGMQVTEVDAYDDSGTPGDVVGRQIRSKPVAPAPKHSQLDTNVQDQRYARVAG